MPVTRCPECATAFRVTDDQLRVRAGKVRCGHCGEVFDALAALESDPSPPGQTSPTAPLAAPVAEVPAASEVRAAIPVSVEAAASPAPEEAAPPASTVRSGSAGKDKASSTPPPMPPEEISFLGPAPARPAHRAAWAVAALLLIGTLLAQLAFYLRGPIALLWPQAKPVLEAACQRLGCEIPLPRRADLVSIETSDLQADPGNPGVMVLAATLRNRASFPQAFPALELTLTNERDQPLARRVLEPRHYLRTPANGAFAASSELQVRLFIEAAALKASGYRLYLFYP